MNDAREIREITVLVPPNTSSEKITDQWVEKARRQGHPALRYATTPGPTYFLNELLCGVVKVRNSFLVLAFSEADHHAHATVNRTVYARPMRDDESMFFDEVAYYVHLRMSFNSPLMESELTALVNWTTDWFGKLNYPPGCEPTFEINASGQLDLRFSEALLSAEAMTQRLTNLVDSCVTGRRRRFWQYLWFAGRRMTLDFKTTPRRVTVTTVLE